MTGHTSDQPGTDAGLLSPSWAAAGVHPLLSDEAWVAAMVEVEVALATVQARLGVVPPSAAEAIARTAAATSLDVTAIAHRATGAANPVVVLVQEFTRAVAQTDPSAAEYVHRGGTSQDILDSAAMLLAGRVLDRIDADLVRIAGSLAALAAGHRDTPMAGRTLTQHAAPVTFGLKAAGWLTLVLDAVDRVRRVRAGLPVQLGGAAGTLSAYQAYAGSAGGAGTSGAGHGMTLMAGLAGELGLAEPAAPWHTQRTPLADLGWVASVVTGALGKLAVDVLGMSRTEVGEVAEPTGEDRGVSSAMPQKRNPVLATVIVAAARQVPAYSLVLAQSMLAEDERAAGGWQSEWQPLREVLRLAAGAATAGVELAAGLSVFPQRMAANLNLTGGAIVSERLNVELAPLLGKAVAKKLLARISREAAATGKPFAELLAVAPELDGRFADARVADELLDPANYLGAADEIVARVLRRHQYTNAQGHEDR
ncbi:adenylosuccinate lyase family protein [Solwaraspora sp. WMMD406]|uniref:class-II fumarase/aspartase family protein n=1 Tax=Solwaraspora sp. WMMD406 TaxID=3016095 RepID=UPI002415DC20|nr:adenylosuccinate lyase family protein [Solwaraspora sp. WMMD406]MDG4765023.1 adenylosuccinate lyase family protein [Solwaraspora sp. WMMD406]